MASIYGVNITTDSIIRCYQKYYPNSYNPIASERLFQYLHLWGIRVGTYDTSLPDDYIGGLRINNLGVNEIIYSSGSVDPSPKNIIELYDAEAKRKGGAAFVFEGQYSYRYMGKNHGSFAPFASFCPIKPVKAYRWNPSESEKALIKSKKLPIASLFDKAKKEGRLKISDSSDTCIHRTWSSTSFWNDSAGCQILVDRNALNTLGSYANEHIAKKYGNVFMYTLFTLDQFMQANTNGEPYNKETAMEVIINRGKYKLGKAELSTLDNNYIISWGRSAFRNRETFTFEGKVYITNGGKIRR
jgi:hypothetical protein